MLDLTLNKIRRLIPAKAFTALQGPYHWTLSFLAALWYRFPSRKIKVIAVTGTKGKSSTVEILNAIMEEAGYKTALSNTIRFKVGDISSENLYKMSMPGRFFVQKIIRKAVNNGCQYMIMEMTSQGALLHRHRFIQMDAFVFTNLSPEHIEAHGSYENYAQSKLSIARQLGKSKKQNRILIVNADDAAADRFMECDADRKTSFSIHDVEPYEIKKEGIEFTLDGRRVRSHLSGLFNLYNITAAITAARSQDVGLNEIVRAIENFNGIPGRVQRIESGQDFTVIVDYAHTADSLEKLYQVFQSSRNICVLGGTGGGRDTSKREIMGKIADTYCDEIILTDEDPYDEDPNKIVADVAKGISTQKPTIIMDRREAIREAIKRAKTGDAILITGKGTDPYIMGAKGTKVPWSDAKVAREEIEKRISI
ncbi:MAG: UDP-N-acetylmuramoyl-L-alanyl-D-glutamate--2,6-diaminopimelate ligase [Candidatus Pacebacteria bacterium]|nr:UDP-N-acetylmuramoyl-L-alanyl-D-glutamate--2,6-diaminopimelate ligase [Candidatus Paceibacterota bacterium]